MVKKRKPICMHKTGTMNHLIDATMIENMAIKLQIRSYIAQQPVCGTVQCT